MGLARYARRLNTRLKLFEKVAILLAVMVLLASVNLVVIYTYHQETERLGNSVNVAGQQRMLSQRMVRLANEIADEDDPRDRDRLRRAVERYDRNLDALDDGGTVAATELNPGAETSADLPSVTLGGERLEPAPPPVDDELRRERTVWTEYREHVRTILVTEPGTPEFRESLSYVRANSDRLLAVSDAVTAEFARVNRDRRSQLNWVLVVLLLFDVAVAAAGVLLTRRFLGLPMSVIARRGRRIANGETDVGPEASIPVDRSLPAHDQRSELSQLARAFDAVENYHRTASEQASALADREFDAAVLDEFVPGELGASLDAMRTDLEAYIGELQATTEKLDAVVEASPVAIVIVDPEGRVTRWNPAAESMFGWSRTEIEGERDPTVPDGEWAQYRGLLSEAIAGDAVTGVERTRVTKGGEAIDASLSLATVPDADGDLSGVMAVVEDITEHKERERTLRQQRDQLAVFGQVTDLLFRITQELLESSSRDRIERKTCETLADSELYGSAWIGEPRHGHEKLVVRAAGPGSAAGERIDLDRDTAVLEAIRAVLEAGEMRVVEPAETAVAPPFGDGERVAVVPLSYMDTVYGVLVVSTDRDVAGQDQERAGLATLGRTIGFAINAIANERLLFTDSVVELTFDVSGTDLPFVRTTADLDCAVSLDGFVKAASGEELRLYLAVEGVEAAAFVDAVTDEPGVAEASAITGDGDPGRVAVTLGAESVFGQILHLECTPRDFDVESGAGTLALEAPADADVEAVVDALRDVDEGVEFVAKTKRDRDVTTAAETASVLQDRLTDRQYEVFKTAYYEGYFEWPRDSTIEELAEGMDIAGSTFSSHLRRAQGKLAAALFSDAERE